MDYEVPGTGQLSTTRTGGRTRKITIESAALRVCNGTGRNKMINIVSLVTTGYARWIIYYNETKISNEGCVCCS